jgi:hypothetical protein
MVEFLTNSNTPKYGQDFALPEFTKYGELFYTLLFEGNKNPSLLQALTCAKLNC